MSRANMKVIFLSSKEYSDACTNYGDCIIIDNGEELIIYDCGHEEHAKRVEEYMKKNGYRTVKIVLSHNDSDHFDGIPYLYERGLVSDVFTLLLLKYKDELLALINDKRRTRESISKSIEEIYNNIYSLSRKVNLKDIFEDTNVASSITIIGPSLEYALNAVAKNIDSRQGDSIDKETIVNAVSTQLSVCFDSRRSLLLTGDSSFPAIEKALKNHSIIQLPHHGKLEQADAIFRVKDNNTIYYVSDNTGSSNGGSDDLKHSKGHVLHNTIDGDQVCSLTEADTIIPRRSYFRG